MNFAPLPTILFVGVVIFCFGLVIQGSVVALRHVRHPNYTSMLYVIVLGLLGWLATLLLLSNNGFFAEWESMPPRVSLALIPALAMCLLALRRSVGEWVDAWQPAALIYVQAYRVLVEVVLWLLYRDGHCPPQLTLEGANWDVVTGLTAPLVAWLAFGGGRHIKWLAIAWNIMGMALLLNVIVQAILSLPQIGVLEPANRMVAYWPMIWLPGFVAPLAMLLHILSLRKLLRG